MSIKTFNYIKNIEDPVLGFQSGFYASYDHLSELNVSRVLYLVMKESLVNEVKPKFVPNGFMTSLTLENENKTLIGNNVSIKLLFNPNSVSIKNV